MVTPSYFPVIGGTESTIANLSAKLNELGVLTDVMSFDYTLTHAHQLSIPLGKEKTEQIDGINVFRIPAFNLLPLRLHSDKIDFMVNLIPKGFTKRLGSYDVIHFHHDLDLSFPFFSYLVDKPKIFHCHCLDTSYHLYKRNFLSRHIFKNVADIYITVSRSDLQLLVQLGMDQEKVRVVPNGVDIKRFQPGGDAKIGNLLLFVGRLQQKKGVHVLLKALDYLKTPVKLVIIGPPTDSEYLERVLHFVKKANDGSFHKATYLGVQRLEELVKWYQKASIFVCPSLSEPFGVVNLEAFACETPVVASNVGGIPEVVKDHQNGILVAPNDSRKLAEGIQFLIDNEKTRGEFGKEGRRLVTREFSSEVIAENFIRLYKEMMA